MKKTLLTAIISVAVGAGLLWAAGPGLIKQREYVEPWSFRLYAICDKANGTMVYVAVEWQAPYNSSVTAVAGACK